MTPVPEAEPQKGPRKGPERTCAACRAHEARDELIRWVRDESGAVVPDLSTRTFGRGVWVHGRPECLKKLQGALSRGFKAPVVTTTAEALQLLHAAAEHRTNQLLGAARRQNGVVFGTDVTAEAWRQGRVFLVLLANDARAAANSGFVADAVTADCVRVWGTKAELGRLFGRAEIGVLGVVDRGLAIRLFGAIAMALLVREPGFGGAQSFTNEQVRTDERSSEKEPSSTSDCSSMDDAQSGQEIEVSSEVE